MNVELNLQREKFSKRPDQPVADVFAADGEYIWPHSAELPNTLFLRPFTLERHVDWNAQHFQAAERARLKLLEEGYDVSLIFYIIEHCKHEGEPCLSLLIDYPEWLAIKALFLHRFQQECKSLGVVYPF